MGGRRGSGEGWTPSRSTGSTGRPPALLISSNSPLFLRISLLFLLSFLPLSFFFSFPCLFSFIFLPFQRFISLPYAANFDFLFLSLAVHFFFFAPEFSNQNQIFPSRIVSNFTYYFLISLFKIRALQKKQKTPSVLL